MDQKNQAVDEFLKDINQMNFETDQMYLNVLSQFNDAINSRISFDELFEHLDLYQTYLETKGFDKAQEIKKCHEKLKESQTEIDQEIEKLEDKLESLKVQIEQEKTQLIDTNLLISKISCLINSQPIKILISRVIKYVISLLVLKIDITIILRMFYIS